MCTEGKPASVVVRMDSLGVDVHKYFGKSVESADQLKTVEYATSFSSVRFGGRFVRPILFRLSARGLFC